MSTHNSGNKYHLCFVCTGNICRSPMGETIAREYIAREGLEDRVFINSCGLGGWHVGQGADRRAVSELAAAGYDGSHHRAAQLGPAHTGADLLIAMDPGHYEGLVEAGVPEDNIRLMRSFDPDSPEGAGVDDPYYGGTDGFTRTRTDIEAAMPGLIEFVKKGLAQDN